VHLDAPFPRLILGDRRRQVKPSENKPFPLGLQAGRAAGLRSRVHGV